MFGGILSLIIWLYVILIMVVKGMAMVLQNDPKIVSIEKAFVSEESIQWNKIDSKAIMQVMKGGDNPLETIELTPESRKYVHIRAVNINESFDKAGEKKEKKSYHEFTSCTANYLESESA